jgi:predicted chitinase
LQTWGVQIAEADLAAECGTTTDGTNYIGTIAQVVNSHIDLHMAEYVTVDLPNDPPTDAEVETFWNHLRESIDAGFGILMNFISPSNNPPFPIKGSGPCPTFYSYGVVYHYTSAAGYSDDGGERAVWVVDSGGAPFGYWLTCRQTAILCAGKGYAYARVKSAPGVPILPGPVAALSLAEKLSYAMDEGLTIEQYGQILPHVQASLAASECNTPERVAMWMAQIGHESQGLLHFEELGGPEYFAQYNDRADLGNRPGTNDGVVYHGRGPIMVTGLSNYQQVSQWAHSKGYVPSPTFFVDEPDKLATWEYGFQSCNWYWVVARGSAINEAADRGDINEATRLINGGYNGLEDRQARYTRALTVAAAFLPTAAPALPPESAMVINPPAPAKTETCLTGRPHHHSENAATEQQVLDIRAEGLCSQALIYAIAEKLGLDAAGIYQSARDSF